MYLTVTLLSMILSGSLKRVLIHTIVWSLFITYELALVPWLNIKMTWMYYVLYYSLNISLFYLSTYLLRNFLRRSLGRVITGVALFLLEFTVYLFLVVWGSYLINTGNIHTPWKDISEDGWRHTIWRGTYFIGFSIAYFFILSAIRATKKAGEIHALQLETEKSLIKLQNAYLQAQLRPHLLFNTLNFIYTQEANVSEQKGQSIIMLADTMRYSIKQTDENGKIDLASEIEQIENYIALNQLRFDGKLCISMVTDVDEVSLQYRIPPLLLLTLVENIFKHGDLTEPEHPAIIELRCSDGALHLYCTNLQRTGNKMPSGNIGITNVRALLQHYYADRFSLELEDRKNSFVTDLIVVL